MKIKYLVAGLAWCLASGTALAETQSFEQALAQAYESNPALQAERARVRAADERVSEALSGWRPDITASGSIGPSHQTYEGIPDGSKTLTAKNAGVQVTQPVFRGFRTVSAVSGAEADVKAARSRLVSSEQQLLLDAGTAYLDVLRDQAVADLERRNEETLATQLRGTRDEFKAGQGTRTDISQGESRLQRATAQRIRAEGALANTRAAYARLMGDMPGTLAQPTLDIIDVKDVDEAARLAETNNPDVAAAGFGVDSAREKVTNVEGNLLPEVNIVGSAVSASGQNILFPNRQDTSQVMAEVKVPLYRSGADYARTRAARETVTQNRLSLEDARRRARENGISAWQALMTAKAALEADRSGISSADVALRGVKELNRAGSRTVLDILNAEQEYLDARVSVVQAERDVAVAKLQLRAAIGSLTAEALGLPVTLYNPQTHYDATRNKWAGFGDAEE